MINTHLVCEMWPNYPGANVVGAALKFRTRKGNLSSCVHVVVLQKTAKKSAKVYNARAEPVFC